MARQISLTRTPYRAEGRSFRYTYVAVGSGSPTTPSEVFVMHVIPLNPLLGTKTAVFSAVATPAQLTDLAVNAPTGNQSYYRTSTYEDVYNDREEADAAWDALQAAVNALLRSLIASDATLVTETVVLTG